MPCSANAFSSLKAGDIVANGDNISDNLVPWDSREHVAQNPLAHKLIAVTDTAGKDLYKNLSLAGLLQVDIFQGELAALCINHGGFEFFW